MMHTLCVIAAPEPDREEVQAGEMGKRGEGGGGGGGGRGDRVGKISDFG